MEFIFLERANSSAASAILDAWDRVRAMNASFQIRGKPERRKRDASLPAYIFKLPADVKTSADEPVAM
jgi:hypothetical protein